MTQTRTLAIVFAVFAVLAVGCGGAPEPAVENPVGGLKTPGREDVAKAQATEQAPATVRLKDLLADLRPVYFDYDSSSIRRESIDGLGKVGEFMTESTDASLVIEGHCDERGSVEYNMALGQQRAQATRAYLVKLGVSASRLKTITYGSERPAVKGHTESAWARNRRAEFVSATE